MTMCSYFKLWTETLLARDLNMENMAIMAASIIIGWDMVRLFPVRWQPWLRKFYMISGLVLFLLTVLISLRGA